jgi:hypothetical protein
VQNALPVRSLKPLGYLNAKLGNQVRGERTSLQSPGKYGTGQQFHHEILSCSLAIEVVNSSDVVVIEFGQDLGFLPELLPAPLVKVPHRAAV